MVVRQEVESTHWILLPLSPREGQEHPRGAQTSPPEIKMTTGTEQHECTHTHTRTHTQSPKLKRSVFMTEVINTLTHAGTHPHKCTHMHTNMHIRMPTHIRSTNCKKSVVINIFCHTHTHTQALVTR